MRASVLGEIDQLGGLTNTADCSFRDFRRIADQRDHATVMIGVHLAIEQINAIHLHGFDNGIDASLVAPFREVGYAFDECGHKYQDKTSTVVPAAADWDLLGTAPSVDVGMVRGTRTGPQFAARTSS